MKIYNKEEIQNLIEKYFEGETSSSQEKILQEYFLQDEVDEDLKQYRPLFNAFTDLTSQPELMEIDLSLVERQNNISITKKSKLKKYLRVSATAIAGIAACIALFFITYHPSSDTFVIIDGKKYTDKTKIQNAFDASIENVRIDLHDVFSDLHEIVMEDE